MTGAVVLSERVQLAVITIVRIVADPELVELHTKVTGKLEDPHLRIRLDTLLTRPEIEQVKVAIKDAVAHYPRVSIENGEWNNKWFLRKKGLIVKLYFGHPAKKEK